jgi:hypothetical protein
MIVNHPRASAALGTIDQLIARLYALVPGESWDAASQ